MPGGLQKGALRKGVDVKQLLKCLEEMQRAISQRTALGTPGREHKQQNGGMPE